jgi:Topoisomerase VI B subunit, transducer
VFTTELNILVGSIKYSEKFSGNPQRILPLTPIDYGDRLFEKFSHGLTDDLTCKRELVSVYHHSDACSNLFVAASAVLILKSLSMKKLIDSKTFDHDDESSSTVQNRRRQAFDAEESVIESLGPKKLGEIRLQLWRYVNGVPLLYSEEASSCFLLTAVKSFNWLAYGHNIKSSDMEANRTNKLLVCQPSLTLTAVRDSKNTQVYKLLPSTGNSVVVDDLLTCSTQQSEIKVTTYNSINGKFDGTSNDDCDRGTLGGNDWMSKKQKNDHIVHDKASTHPDNVDERIALSEVVEGYNSQLSSTMVGSQSVEARDLIVILDINMPDGKKLHKVLMTNPADYHLVDTIVSYVSVAKTGVSGDSKSFQTAINKGQLQLLMEN